MYVGLETSSTSLNLAVVDDGGERIASAAVDRFDLADGPGVVERVAELVPLADVEMGAVCFAWGDAISSIRSASEVPGKGNRGTAGFVPKPEDAAAFDQFASAPFPTVAIPGVHDGIETLHPYFQHYAQLSGPDQVGAARYAQQVTERAGGDGETFVSANASSSTRALLVADGELRGAFHWLGLVHGWPDGTVFERIVHGEVDPRLAAQRAGLLYKPGAGHAEWPDADGGGLAGVARREAIAADLDAAEDDETLLELVYWATLHDVYSLAPFAAHDADGGLERVVVSGRLARVEEPFDVRGRLTGALSTLAPTTVAEPFAAVTGTALLARDVAVGADDVLGIPVSR